MNKILLPVDFSERSASAAKYAAALAGESQAEVSVLHVAPGRPAHTEVNDLSASPAFALEIAWEELRQQEATEEMTEFVSRHLQGVAVAPCVRTGDAAKVIVESAAAAKADLIVMGTHGLGRFRRMLLGSITAKVLHDANCAVFTTAHAESTPAKIPPFRRVLCAVDFGLQSEAVVRWADQFARTMDAELYISHVLPVIPTGQFGYCEVDVSIPMRKDAEEQGQILLKATGAQGVFSVETGPVVGALRALANNKRADLLVIGRHHESGLLGRLRETAYAIIRESPCPVVSV